MERKMTKEKSAVNQQNPSPGKVEGSSRVGASTMRTMTCRCAPSKKPTYVDGTKPARTRASFTKTYKMDALQLAQCGSMVLYRKVPFKQKRLWLGVDSTVSRHGTCHSLKNDAKFLAAL